MNTSIQHPEPNGIVQPLSNSSQRGAALSALRSPSAPFVWVALLAGLLFLFFSAPAAFAQRSPPGCLGSGLGISLFTSLPDVHIGDTISYSVNVFNSPFPACDAGNTNAASAGAIYAFIVTPDGVTNHITLRRTYLAPGDSDFYTNVVSYVVRAQDIRPDGTIRATAIDQGEIWQNDVHSSGGGNQGVNTQVNLPCVLIAAQCVGSVGENGRITFTGTVTNCGNNTLVGVTVTNYNDNGYFTVLFPTNLAFGEVASFSGSWVPANPCGPSTAILTVLATDQFTSTPRTLTNFTTITCQNILTPGINVTKACPAQPVSPGQLLTYSGSVSNTGNVTLTNIVVVDSQPAANTPVFTLASLAPGAVANFTGSYTAPTNCSVSDTLTATASSRCGVGVSSIASVTCPILTTPQIAVAVSCPSTPAVPGGTLTYSGNVRNVGNTTLTGIVVVGDRPAPNTTVFTVATLAPGASANFTSSLTVPADSCSLTTTFSGVGKDICTPNMVTNTVPITCPITTAPAVAVTLACPATPVATGGLITYSGTVRNSGNVTLNNVTVVNSQSVPSTVLTVPSLAPGASANFTASFTAPADACSVSSTVTASGSDNCTQNVVNNSASATCTLVTTPRIAVTQNCPANPPSLGGVLTYSGTVSNAGNITLTNVVVTDDRTGANSVFTVATLAPGASSSFTGSYTVPASGCAVTSTLTANASDKCTGTLVTASATATCPVQGASNIAVTLACPATPTPLGGLLTFSGTVSNAGNVTLTNVVVTRDAPAPNTSVFTAASLAPGASANFTGSYTVPGSDACAITTSVSASANDQCAGSGVIARATISCPLVTTPGIVVTQNCPPNPANPGGVLNFSGTVSNAGNITLTNIVVVNNQSAPNTNTNSGPLTFGTINSVSSAVVNRFVVGASFNGLTYAGEDHGYGATEFYSMRKASTGTSFFDTIIASTANTADRFDASTRNFDALAYAAPDVGYGPLLFYYLSHDNAGVSTFGSITPGGAVGVTADHFVVGNNFDALTFAATDVGYGANLFYYVRHDATGLSTFGTINPALPGTITDRFTVGFNVDALVFTDLSAPGYGANNFYYLRHDASGVSTFGTIFVTGLTTATVTDRFTVGTNATELTFTATDVGFGANLFYFLRGGGNTTGTNTQPVFTASSLAPGATATFTGSYIVPSSNTCSVTAIVTATGNDSCSGNTVTNTITTTCPLTTTPRIAVTLNCPEVPVATGALITYNGTVSNPGNVTLNNVVVVNNQASPSTVLTLPSLAPGGFANFTASFTAPAGACSVSSTVTASGSDACVGTVVTNFASATCPITTAPAIAVTLACPATPAASGGPIIYSGTVRNSGNVILNNVTVVNSQAVPSTVLTMPSLAPGVSANFTANLTAPVDACSISSTVTATGSDACTSALVNASASATCSLTAAPSIVVTQVCPASPAVPGSTLTFSGTVRNTGNTTLTNVVVLNDLSGATPVFTSATLAPGATASFTGSYLTPTNCTTTSTSTATARSVCGVAVSNSSTVTCTILTTPQISVTAVCPTAPVAPGGTLTYSGTVRNTGNITLKNVAVVSDRPAANTTVFTAPTLAPGASAAFTGSYVVPADACSLTANLRATGQDQCTDAAVTSTFASTCNSTTAPAIAVTLACPTGGSSPGVDIAQGKSATQSSTYSYFGILYPADFAVDGNTDGNAWDHSVSITGYELNAWWQVDLGSVRDLQTIKIWGRTDTSLDQSSNLYLLVSDNPFTSSNLTATLAQPGVSSYYTPGYAGAPGTYTINRTGRYIRVQLAATDFLSLSEVQVYETPTVTNAGPIITYTGTVRNSGNVTLNNVVVVNDHPAPNTVVLTVPSLAAGASANFTASFNIPLDICSASSTVNASGSDACSGASVNGTASATCPLVTTPGIVVTQNCPPNPASPGGVLAYSGTVSNAGNITLTNVVVTNDRTGTSPVFSAPTLAPGAVLGFTGSYTVPASSACAITSTLTGSGNDKCSGDRVAATASSTCPLLTAPLITVTQTCPVNLVSAGGILTYSGTVLNAGNITLTNVVVLNNRPADNTVVFTAASLAPGASANFSGSYEVPINCCVVWSTATASGNDTCTGNTVTDTDTTTCTVLTAPRIVVTKVCPPTAVQPGDVLHYSGTVSNAGNISLVDVTIVNSQPGDGSTVWGPITLAPGESANYYASYLVPPDFCGTDTITARGLDACTLAPVVNSVTTTCPVLTTPRIAVTKNCPAQATPRGGVFTFTGTVSNPGDVTLTNVMVANNYEVDCYLRTNGPVIGPITLAPGASVNFSGSYTAPLSCCEVMDTLTASGQDRCAGTRVMATATAVCPLLSTPRITVTRVCPASPVPVGSVFAYSGSVSNAGDVVLTNVIVLSSQPNANTIVLAPMALAPGETEMFSGSYTVTANSDPTRDTVTASGADICQGRTVTATANCSGPVGPLIVSSVTIANGTATVTWMAKSGVTYRLQWASNNQNSVWNTVPGDVTATGDTASKNDAVGTTPQRYYRVMVVK